MPAACTACKATSEIVSAARAITAVSSSISASPFDAAIFAPLVAAVITAPAPEPAQ